MLCGIALKKALKEAYHEKVHKYRLLGQMLRQEFDQPVEIQGLLIGACGAHQ